MVVVDSWAEGNVLRAVLSLLTTWTRWTDRGYVLLMPQHRCVLGTPSWLLFYLTEVRLRVYVALCLVFFLAWPFWPDECCFVFGRLVWLRPSQLLSTVYNFDFQLNLLSLSDTWRGRRGRDRMVVGFKTTYAISAYHRWCCMWVWISIWTRCTTLCDKVCQWLTTGRWFSQGPPVSSTNKTDRHDITEILLKMVLSTIKQTSKPILDGIVR
jgi:hypothetical protein